MDIKLMKLKIKLFLMYKGKIIPKTINPENAQRFLDAINSENANIHIRESTKQPSCKIINRPNN